MPADSSEPVAVGRRMDLATFLCMVARHGPAVVLAAAALLSLLLGLLVYVAVRRGWRWRWRKASGSTTTAAAAAGTEGEAIRARVEPSPEETHRRGSLESTGAINGGWSNIKEGADLYTHELKLRHRRAAAVVDEKKKIPSPDSHGIDIQLTGHKKSPAEETTAVRDSYGEAEKHGEESAHRSSCDNRAVPETNVGRAGDLQPGSTDEDVIEKVCCDESCRKTPELICQESQERDPEKVFKDLEDVTKDDDVTEKITRPEEQRNQYVPINLVCLDQTSHLNDCIVVKPRDDKQTPQTNGNESNLDESTLHPEDVKTHNGDNLDYSHDSSNDFSPVEEYIFEEACPVTAQVASPVWNNDGDHVVEANGKDADDWEKRLVEQQDVNGFAGRPEEGPFATVTDQVKEKAPPSDDSVACEETCDRFSGEVGPTTGSLKESPEVDNQAHDLSVVQTSPPRDDSVEMCDRFSGEVGPTTGSLKESPEVDNQDHGLSVVQTDAKAETSNAAVSSELSAYCQPPQGERKNESVVTPLDKNTDLTVPDSTALIIETNLKCENDEIVAEESIYLHAPPPRDHLTQVAKGDSFAGPETVVKDSVVDHRRQDNEVTPQINGLESIDDSDHHPDNVGPTQCSSNDFFQEEKTNQYQEIKDPVETGPTPPEQYQPSSLQGQHFLVTDNVTSPVYDIVTGKEPSEGDFSDKQELQTEQKDQHGLTGDLEEVALLAVADQAKETIPTRDVSDNVDKENDQSSVKPDAVAETTEVNSVIANNEVKDEAAATSFDQFTNHHIPESDMPPPECEFDCQSVGTTAEECSVDKEDDKSTLENAETADVSLPVVGNKVKDEAAATPLDEFTNHNIPESDMPPPECELDCESVGTTAEEGTVNKEHDQSLGETNARAETADAHLPVVGNEVKDEAAATSLDQYTDPIIPESDMPPPECEFDCESVGTTAEEGTVNKEHDQSLGETDASAETADLSLPVVKNEVKDEAAATSLDQYTDLTLPESYLPPPNGEPKCENIGTTAEESAADKEDEWSIVKTDAEAELAQASLPVIKHEDRDEVRATSLDQCIDFTVTECDIPSPATELKCINIGTTAEDSSDLPVPLPHGDQPTGQILDDIVTQDIDEAQPSIHPTNTEDFVETSDAADPSMSENITDPSTGGETPCPHFQSICTETPVMSDETFHPDILTLSHESSLMTQDLNPPVRQIHLPVFEQSELTDDVRDYVSSSVGEESGISSMAVSPDLQDGGREFGKIVEEMVDYGTESKERMDVQKQTDWTFGSSALNEDMSGLEVEDRYHASVDEFMMQVAANNWSSVDQVKKLADTKGAPEVVGIKETKEVRVTKKMETETGSESEELYEKTEISIMEATMDHNEWIMESSYQGLPWMNIPVPSFAQDNTKTDQLTTGIRTDTETSAHPSVDENTENNKKVVAVQPINVTFRVHYITHSPYQMLAVTGNQQELGNWKDFIPLESAMDGYWTTVVSLPAESHVEWKFVVVDNKGSVCRWEECGNRLLDTGYGDDMTVHKLWGYL